MASSFSFPMDLFCHDAMPGEVGNFIRATADLSLYPPYPWGQWMFDALLKKRWSVLAGDIAELGVALGGMSIFLGLLAKKLNKKVCSYDSFAGLPEPHSVRDNPYFKQGDYDARVEGPDLLQRFIEAIGTFHLEKTVIPRKGFFKDTLKTLPKKRKFCFVHLDSDLYESVLTSLDAMYDRVVDGGVIAIDDFFHHAQGPLRAASDFFNARRLSPVYHVNFPYSVFIFKGEERDKNYRRSLDGNIYSFEWLKRDRYFRKVLESPLKKGASAVPKTSQSHAKTSRHEQNRMLLVTLLKSRGHRSSDIYTYWRSLEAFWDSFANRNQPFARPVKRI